MNRRILVGALAGVVAGVVFGLLMEILPVSVLFEAQTAHLRSRLVGWLACLVYGVIIGGIFGFLLQGQRLEEGPAVVWGGIYGIGWWVLAGLILLPAGLGSVPLSSDALMVVRPVALALLAGHLLYGLLLGAVFPAVDRRLAGHSA